MSNQTITPVRQLEVLHPRQKRLGLQLHSQRQKPSSARAQNIRQGILEFLGLTQADNIGRCVHGVSLSSEVLAGSTPASIRRLHTAVVTQFPS